MVKKQVGGGKRYKAAANAQVQGLSQPKWDGPAPPVHVQKKLARKVKFLSKVSDTANKLSVKKSGSVSKKQGRKKSLPDLNSLGAVLEEAAQREAEKANTISQQKKRGTAVKSAKQRQHILIEESQRLQHVLQHKLYRADPIAAITNHLQHTLPSISTPKPVKGKRS